MVRKSCRREKVACLEVILRKAEPDYDYTNIYVETKCCDC